MKLPVEASLPIRCRPRLYRLPGRGCEREAVQTESPQALRGEPAAQILKNDGVDMLLARRLDGRHLRRESRQILRCVARSLNAPVELAHSPPEPRQVTVAHRGRPGPELRADVIAKQFVGALGGKAAAKYRDRHAMRLRRLQR
jgi:hypothetical protein